MKCDICDDIGVGTIVSVSNFKKAVNNGFNPFQSSLMKSYQVDLWKMTASMLNKSNVYECWREQALFGDISLSDWNVCPKCMNTLRPYLSSSGTSKTQNKPSQPGKSTSNDSCFIATACYGNYDAPEVVIFRQFRDNFLAHNLFGSYFIKYYYRWSPSLARWIKRHSFISMTVRIFFLHPIYKCINHLYD